MVKGRYGFIPSTWQHHVDGYRMRFQFWNAVFAIHLEDGSFVKFYVEVNDRIKTIDLLVQCTDCVRLIHRTTTLKAMKPVVDKIYEDAKFCTNVLLKVKNIEHFQK